METEALGLAIDRIENLMFALQMPLGATTHVELMKKLLPEILEELKAGFIETTGGNPWE